MPSQNAMEPMSGRAISITDDFDELNNPSTNNLKASVSPKKTNFMSETTNAITKKAIQI
jgi:hypothetical protein